MKQRNVLIERYMKFDRPSVRELVKAGGKIERDYGMFSIIFGREKDELVIHR